MEQECLAKCGGKVIDIHFLTPAECFVDILFNKKLFIFKHKKNFFALEQLEKLVQLLAKLYYSRTVEN